MTFKCFTLLVLLTAALAAPVADFPTHPFTLTVAHTRHTELNGQKINAASLALFLGLVSPSTFCPSPPLSANECPAGTETAFSGLLSMDVEVPGGQLAYVGPDGALGYTQAHSANIPPGSFTAGFSWTPLHTNSVLGERGELDFSVPGQGGETGFFACPGVPAYVPGATYQIFAQVPGFTPTEECVELGRLRTTEFQGGLGAWQYT